MRAARTARNTCSISRLGVLPYHLKQQTLACIAACFGPCALIFLSYTLYDRLAFMRLDLSADWQVDWLRLDVSSKIIPEFRPSLVVVCSGCFPQADGAFWSSSPKARAPPNVDDDASEDDMRADGDAGDEDCPQNGDDCASKEPASDDGSSENPWELEDRTAHISVSECMSAAVSYRDGDCCVCVLFAPCLRWGILGVQNLLGLCVCVCICVMRCCGVSFPAMFAGVV